MRQQTRPLKEPAEKVVQDIRRATRKHYLAEEKIRIVLEGLRGEDSIAELIRFRHFCSGSLALASLDRACRNLVPAFPQRSPPRLLTAAACGGLRSAPDRRTRRALLHLSYSCAPPVLTAMLVTHDPQQTSGPKRQRFSPVPNLIRPARSPTATW